MEQYGEIMAGAGVAVYVVIGLFVVIFIWWGYHLIKGKKEPKTNMDLPTDEPSFEEELATDVLEIITVFSARLYGSRSKKNRKLMESLQTEGDKIIARLEKK